jgi:hypothetical protein
MISFDYQFPLRRRANQLEDEVVYMALTQPFTYSDLQDSLADLSLQCKFCTEIAASSDIRLAFYVTAHFQRFSHATFTV